MFQVINSQDVDSNAKTRSKNLIGIYTNIGINRPIMFISTDDEMIYLGRGTYSVGVKYSRSLSKNLMIEFGANYSKYKVRMEAPEDFPIPNVEPFSETFSTISIPVQLSLYTLKNYFISFGTLIDFDLPRGFEWIMDTQSGLGLTFGVGKEFIYNTLTLDIIPNLEIHSLIPFKIEDNKQRLLVFGLKVGLNFKIN